MKKQDWKVFQTHKKLRSTESGKNCLNRRNQEKPYLYVFTFNKAYSLHRSCYCYSWPYNSMFVIKVVILATLQFWQLSIQTTFSFNNFQFWLFSSKIFGRGPTTTILWILRSKIRFFFNLWNSITPMTSFNINQVLSIALFWLDPAE